jgi:JmjC domain
LTDRSLGHGPEHRSSPALSRLVATDPDEFARDYWGRRPLLSPAAALPQPGFTDLLSASAIDELVSERGLRTPFLRVAKAGATLPEPAFTAPGGVGATIADQVSDDKLTTLFADGATIVLQGLHRTCPPVLEFCQHLTDELGHPVQANAYVTPPQNQGFGDHYDVHDVFVLQVEGEKRWVVHEPVLDSPLRDQPWQDRRSAVQARATEPPAIEAVLSPGDCLYLPRGFLHAAQALGVISTHLTLGVHVWTRYAIAEQLVRHAIRDLAGDAALRASLPLGVDFVDGAVEGEIASVQRALVDALGRVDPDVITAALGAAARDSSRAAPIGPLTQFRVARDLQEQHRLQLRGHLAPNVRRHSGGSVLQSRAGQLDLGVNDTATAETFLARGWMTAGELGLEFARRLVVAGIAVVTDGSTG